MSRFLICCVNKHTVCNATEVVKGAPKISQFTRGKLLAFEKLCTWCNQHCRAMRASDVEILNPACVSLPEQQCSELCLLPGVGAIEWGSWQQSRCPSWQGLVQ